MEKKNSTLANIPTEYFINEAARVIDRKQQTLYVKHNLRPIDMYTSIDDDGRDIIVMLFDKKESYPYYQQWLNRTLE